jgi:hypothetical protein
MRVRLLLPPKKASAIWKWSEAGFSFTSFIHPSKKKNAARAI